MLFKILKTLFDGLQSTSSGNVGVRVDYVCDPMTGRMTTEYDVNLTGAMNLGVKDLLELIKELME